MLHALDSVLSENTVVSTTASASIKSRLALENAKQLQRHVAKLVMEPHVLSNVWTDNVRAMMTAALSGFDVGKTVTKSK